MPDDQRAEMGSIRVLKAPNFNGAPLWDAAR